MCVVVRDDGEPVLGRGPNVWRAPNRFGRETTPYLPISDTLKFGG